MHIVANTKHVLVNPLVVKRVRKKVHIVVIVKNCPSEPILYTTDTLLLGECGTSATLTTHCLSGPGCL